MNNLNICGMIMLNEWINEWNEWMAGWITSTIVIMTFKVTWIMSLTRSEFQLTRTLMNKYPICFSEYLLEDNRLTASMWPKSMSWPSKKIKSNLQTYFFFWYPSRVLSPLNLERMLASSLLIRFTSASLLLQLRMSEMKTARPRIPSPFTAGIFSIPILIMREKTILGRKKTWPVCKFPLPLPNVFLSFLKSQKYTLNIVGREYGTRMIWWLI